MGLGGQKGKSKGREEVIWGVRVKETGKRGYRRVTWERKGDGRTQILGKR